jgi:hypothetical protein
MLPENKVNILYLADLSSIHDRKWIDYFLVNGFSNSYVILRKIHLNSNKEWIKRCGYRVIGTISDHSVIRFYRTFATLVKIRSLIKRYGIQCFHILYAEPNSLWAVYRKFLGCPTIITCRGTDVLKTIPEFFSRTNILKRIVSTLYQKSFATNSSRSTPVLII